MGVGGGKRTEVETLTLLLQANELKGENSFHPPICALQLYYIAPDFLMDLLNNTCQNSICNFDLEIFARKAGPDKILPRGVLNI